MSLYSLIAYCSIIAWLFPPFRQYKGRFFYYFYILAIADPIAYMFIYHWEINANLFLFSLSLLQFYTVFPNKSQLKNPYIITSALVLIIILGFLGTEIQYIGFLLVHISILVLFLKRTIVIIFEKYEINFFYIVLVFYELTLSTRCIGILLEIHSDYVFHYLVMIVQIFVAIFFTLYREDKPRIVYKLSHKTG